MGAVRPTAPAVLELPAVTVRLCGDSGDGMQLAGAQLARASVRMGNAVASLTDFPAEIRAPAGTLAGVSGFQVHFSSRATATPGDRLNALVAMNPAALQANLRDLEPDGLLLVNLDAFTPAEWSKAGYARNPLHDGSLAAYRVVSVAIDQLNRAGLAKVRLTSREIDRCRNFFTLGLVCWLFDRSIDPIIKWIKAKFASNPAAMKGNSRALKAGWQYAEKTPLTPERYAVPKAPLPEGTYRHLTGTDGLILGMRTAARQAGRTLIFACTPMTPASELLHQILDQPSHDARGVQADDEAAAAGIALGASFAGSVGATATSGPGLCQMAEIVALGVMTELPLVVIDIQRGGPSTGLPTKTEQSDLLQAMFGRNGECPAVVLAPSSPSDCFAISYEAVRIACRFMTPVVVLSDVFLANGSEPWRIPTAEELPAVELPIVQEGEPFLPYRRDERLARPWAAVGTPDQAHRIGGLEKDRGTGAVSYDPLNHEEMVALRAEKVAGVANVIPELVVEGAADATLLVIGWGSTAGTIAVAAQRVIQAGGRVAYAHLRHLNPLPRNTGEVLKQYRRILVPELNSGQLKMLLRSQFLVDAVGLSRIQGRPFHVGEIVDAIQRMLI